MKISKKRSHYEIDLKINKETLIPIILVVACLAINLYYFSANSGVWWDEAEYLSFVNHIVKGSPYSMWEGRAIFYPLLLSVFGFINLSETFLRIGLVVISCLTTLFIFLVLKKMFKTKIAVIATSLFLTNWLFNFFSLRFLTGIPSLMFQMISLYFFLQNKPKSRIYSGIFLGCAIATRFTALLLIPSFILYDLLSIKKKISIDYLKKFVWVPAILLGFAPIVAYDLIIGRFPFETFYTFLVQSMAPREWGHNLGDWTYYIVNFPAFTGIIGVFFLFMGLLFIFSKIKSKNMKKYALMLSYILFHLIAYSFLTQLKEQRYIIPVLPYIFAIISIGIISISNTIGKFFKKKLKFKYANYLLMISVALSIIIPSLNMGNISILNSASGYEELRISGEEILANTNSDEIIITNAGPHISYYSQREVTGFPANMSDLFSTLESNENINYIVFSLYETVPEYLTNLSTDNFTLIQELSRNDVPMVIAIQYLRE